MLKSPYLVLDLNAPSFSDHLRPPQQYWVNVRPHSPLWYNHTPGQLVQLLVMQQGQLDTPREHSLLAEKSER